MSEMIESIADTLRLKPIGDEATHETWQAYNILRYVFDVLKTEACSFDIVEAERKIILKHLNRFARENGVEPPPPTSKLHQRCVSILATGVNSMNSPFEEMAEALIREVLAALYGWTDSQGTALDIQRFAREHGLEPPHD